MNNLTLGIDVSMETLDVMLLKGKEQETRKFKNNQKSFEELVAWLDKKEAREAMIGLESTGRYGLPLGKHLYAAGLKVSMINPAWIKFHGQSQGVRNKTDKFDAFVIADYCRKNEMRLWEPPSPEMEELQEMTRFLGTLKKSQQQTKNRKKSGYTSIVVNEELNRVHDFFEREIEAMRDRILKHIHAHEELRKAYELILSVKGVGPISAPIFLAEIQDPNRFDNASQLAAYAGVTPKNHQSGKSINKPGKMTKAGNIYLRTALYMPALSAKDYNPLANAQYDRLIENGKPPNVALGAAMHKLLRIIYGVWKNGCPFDPDYGHSS